MIRERERERVCNKDDDDERGTVFRNALLIQKSSHVRIRLNDKNTVNYFGLEKFNNDTLVLFEERKIRRKERSRKEKRGVGGRNKSEAHNLIQ